MNNLCLLTGDGIEHARTGDESAGARVGFCGELLEALASGARTFVAQLPRALRDAV
jgi:hypothetical protein